MHREHAGSQGRAEDIAQQKSDAGFIHAAHVVEVAAAAGPLAVADGEAGLTDGRKVRRPARALHAPGEAKVGIDLPVEDLLFLELTDAWGRPIFRSPGAFENALGVSLRIEDPALALFRGMRIRSSVASGWPASRA